MKYYLAIDLGASSGRHIVGYLDNGEIKLDEVYRFKTGMNDGEDGLVWDIPLLYKEIKIGIKRAFRKYPEIESLSIDTWGVDYVLMNGDKEIPPFYAYRNDRCERSARKVHSIVKFEDIYKKTGIQFAAFNTIYQLYDDLLQGRLEEATDYLMLPSYFIYKLTGIKTHEYSNESTGAFLDVKTGKYDYELIDQLGLPRKLFNDIQMPGTVVGELLPHLQKSLGGNCKVVLCATHDTGSAFEAVEVPEDGVILSSGTWSLLGVKSKEPIVSEVSLAANYTNEGGVGYIRLLKNIMGMWINNELRFEANYTQQFVDDNIRLTTYNRTFDVNDASLVAPKSMKDAVYELLKDNPPKNYLEMFASIYHSLAYCYKKAIEELESITGKEYHSVYIIGGGAKNLFLNELVEQYTNKKVVALPIEATSLGNIKVQMKVGKEL